MAGRSVVVVGGGVIGCAIARALAHDRDVTVLERDDLASGATALAAGEVTMTPSYVDRPAVAAHANRFFRAYDGTGDFEYHASESLELVGPEREGEARRRVERLVDADLDVAFLEAPVVEDRYPRFDLSAFAGAVRHADTGYLDPYTLTTSLATDARERGAEIRTETSVESVVVEDGAVQGVATPAGQVDADVVVAAAGWRTPDLVAELVGLPVRPYRTQCVVLEPAEPLPGGFPMGWVPDGHVYFRPEVTGDLLVGGWSKAEDDPERASGDADEAFRDHVAELLPAFLRGFDRAGFVNGWAGVDGATPDTRPVIDAPADAPDGLVVATGFHGRGVMTAPVAATAVRALLGGEAAPFPTDGFAVDRFESRSRDFEFHSISA